MLLCVIMSLGAWAQSAKNVFEIDPASFRPVQTDALSGVAIDKIALDRSKRPCARIKLHINRMSREDIDRLEVKVIGGNVELIRKQTAYEGNGLILEMTAKEQTRFYLHHDKYGDSNDVTLNLEGDREYRLEAQLNLLLPITVVSNVKGADVFVDGTYKGVTNNNYILTVEDVLPGNHKIAIKQGAATTEQMVNVSSSNVTFRIEVNDETSQPQYVVFEIEPKYATLFIDNEPQPMQDGYAMVVLQNGMYSYRVMAKGYHEHTGNFTVSGEKVIRKISLEADVAMVTISSVEDAEIWVNNEKKGVGSWSGQLLSGTYIFEARKTGCRTTILSQAITSTTTAQSYSLDAPTPIVGSLNIISMPPMASVKVDGQLVGETPLMTKMLVGNHTVEVSKNGYITWRKTIVVTEGQTTSLSAMLTKVSDGVGDNAVNYTTTPSNSQPQHQGRDSSSKKSTYKGYGCLINAFGGCELLQLKVNAYLNVINGYHFNPYFYLGAGVGVKHSMYCVRIRHSDGFFTYNSFPFVSMPIFLYGQCTILRLEKRVRPYLSFGIGGDIALNTGPYYVYDSGERYYYEYSWRDYCGCYLEPSLGVFVRLNRKINLNIALTAPISVGHFERCGIGVMVGVAF